MMNTMPHMKDPAAGVPPQLLPHMHLVSKHRYPTVSNLSLETIVGYLMEAPKIMRDLQPVQWQFLDPPPHEGRLMLVWQPLEHVGTSFASDGYVWGDAEQAFKSEVRGYSLEMFLHRSGYQAPSEPMASHSRKRYRLLPGNPALGLPHPDPSLWIVHYSKAAPRDHIPAASIPISPYVNASIQQRRMIQASGPLVRKDFMLHDRASWPTINPPPGIAGRHHSQQIQGGHRPRPSVNFVPGEATLEEEEDVSRGDTLDFMTPRDISRMRYEQHHEWMEEILESHYATKKITPTDLGLGRKGELETLTSGFFVAPTTVLPEANVDAVTRQVGKMETEKAGDFTKKAASKIAEMQAELERMKRKHARRMERLRKTTALSTAEKKLRNASFTSDDQGRRSMSSGATANATAAAPNTADAIIEEIEQGWGKKIENVTNVNMVEKGGLDERATANGAFNSRNVMSPTKQVFSPNIPHNAAPQQDAMAQYRATLAQQQQPQEPQQRPQHQEVPLQAALANQTASLASASVPASESESTDSGVAAVTIATSEKVKSPTQDEMTEPADPDMTTDVDMAGLEDENEEPQLEMDDNAWVMVDEDEDEDEDEDDNVATAFRQSRDPSQAPDIIQRSSTEASSNTPPESGEQGQTPPAPGQTSVEAEQPETTPALETGEFELSGDFDDVDVDTAGDALDDYGSGGDDLSLDPMDDSAFADAFHPHEDENTPMDENENEIS